MSPARTYMLFEALFGMGMGFTAACYSPNLLRIGVSMPEIAMLNGLFFLSVVLAELPTGMIADGRGRGWSVRVGAVIAALGLASYAAASGFWTAALAEIGIGIGFAFLSGALQAWVTDALHARGECDRIRKTFGGAAALRALGAVAGGVLGAMLGEIDLRAGWIAGSLTMAAAGAVAFAFIDDSGEPEHRVGERAALAMSVRALRDGPALRWAVAASAVFGLVLSFNHYWSLFFLEKTGQAGLGAVWALAYGALAVGSFLIRRSGQDAPATGVVTALFAAGAGLAVTSSLPGIALPLVAVMVHEVARGAFVPMLDCFVQKRVSSEYRATFGSLQSFCGKVGWSGILGCTWLLTRDSASDGALIGRIWTVNGMLLMAAAGGFLVWSRLLKRRALAASAAG